MKWAKESIFALRSNQRQTKVDSGPPFLDTRRSRVAYFFFRVTVNFLVVGFTRGGLLGIVAQDYTRNFFKVLKP